MSTLLRSACFGLLLAGCLPTEPSERDALRRNRARWEARRPAAYQFTFQRGWCECLPEWTLPLRVTVRGEHIEAAVDLRTGEPVDPQATGALSVDGLFRQVEDALEQDVHRLEVTYHRTLGYPTSIRMDLDARMVDDEISLTAGDLQSVP